MNSKQIAELSSVQMEELKKKMEKEYNRLVSIVYLTGVQYPDDPNFKLQTTKQELWEWFESALTKASREAYDAGFRDAKAKSAKVVEQWMEDEEHWQPIANAILNLPTDTQERENDA